MVYVRSAVQRVYAAKDDVEGGSVFAGAKAAIQDLRVVALMGGPGVEIPLVYELSDVMVRRGWGVHTDAEVECEDVEGYTGMDLLIDLHGEGPLKGDLQLMLVARVDRCVGEKDVGCLGEVGVGVRGEGLVNGYWAEVRVAVSSQVEKPGVHAEGEHIAMVVVVPLPDVVVDTVFEVRRVRVIVAEGWTASEPVKVPVIGFVGVAVMKGSNSVIAVVAVFVIRV